MRFVVYGAGAVGGTLGALLFTSGHDVILIARGGHLSAIAADGLRLIDRGGDRTLPIKAVASPRDIDWRQGDVVLLCVKSQDTESALREVPEGVPVFCVQNGVANERMALRHFADVYGVCVMFPTSHLEPGIVVQDSWPTPGILNLGRYPSGVDDRSGEVAAAFRAAGFVSEPTADIMRWKYRKLLMNLGNAVQAVCGLSGAEEIAARVRAEGEAVLRAAGIDFASREEDRAQRGDVLKVADTRTGGSSWQSLARGTGSIEADYLNGEIVLLGRLAGVDAPRNEHARRLANRFARQGIPVGSLSPAEWLSTMDL
jgi:2-dehydropantoate 2-reductase